MNHVKTRFDKRMTFLINQETWEILQKIAERRKLTNSDLAREAIYQFIGKQRQNEQTNEKQ